MALLWMPTPLQLDQDNLISTYVAVSIPRPTRPLDVDDFSLLVDGSPEEIVRVLPGPQAVRLVIALDQSDSVHVAAGSVDAGIKKLGVADHRC